MTDSKTRTLVRIMAVIAIVLAMFGTLHEPSDGGCLGFAQGKQTEIASP